MVTGIFILFWASCTIINVAAKGSNSKETIEILTENAKFAIFERETSEPKNQFALKANEKLSEQFQADPSKKIQLRFNIKERKSGSFISVHQSFVVFVHTASKREIIFVAEKDKATKNYLLDIDLKMHAKDFSGISGKYSIRLILGDARIANPLDWHFADVTLSVPKVEPTPVPKSKQINYERLPEIDHKFRGPELRPSHIISDAFTLVCLVPSFMLLGLWARIGGNASGFRISFWSLAFHACLSAVFALYLLYWHNLNMFQTLKYLTILAVPTFACGNRFLQNFGEAKKQKAE